MSNEKQVIRSGTIFISPQAQSKQTPAPSTEVISNPGKKDLLKPNLCGEKPPVRNIETVQPVQEEKNEAMELLRPRLRMPDTILSQPPQENPKKQTFKDILVRWWFKKFGY